MGTSWPFLCRPRPVTETWGASTLRSREGGEEMEATDWAHSATAKGSLREALVGLTYRSFPFLAQDKTGQSKIEPNNLADHNLFNRWFNKRRCSRAEPSATA